MKKLILTIAILFCFVTLSFAADGTVTGDASQIYQSGPGDEIMRITYTVTFAADNNPPVEVALNSILDTNGVKLPRLGGWWLLNIDTYPGTTAPTANTDFYLWSVDQKIDILGGNGVDSIDGAATYNTFFPLTSSRPLTGTEVFDVTDSNAVNSAVTYIVFTLYR